MKLPTEEQLQAAKEDYDQRCHCSHSSGEDPSYHFEAGFNYLKHFQTREIVEPQDVQLGEHYWVKPFLNSELEIAQVWEVSGTRYFYFISVLGSRKFPVNNVHTIQEYNNE